MLTTNWRCWLSSARKLMSLVKFCPKADDFDQFLTQSDDVDQVLPATWRVWSSSARKLTILIIFLHKMMIFIKIRPHIHDVDQVLTTNWWFWLSVDHKLMMLIKCCPQSGRNWSSSARKLMILINFWHKLMILIKFCQQLDEFGQVLPESWRFWLYFLTQNDDFY